MKVEVRGGGQRSRGPGWVRLSPVRPGLARLGLVEGARLGPGWARLGPG